MVFLFVFLTSFASIVAQAQGSYLFGEGALASRADTVSVGAHDVYRSQVDVVLRLGFRPLSHDVGSDRALPLRILIKDESLRTPVTTAFVDTLVREKSTLMELYGLSDRDYNRLAAIAFGILGRETKFGKSLKYKLKERTPPLVAAAKYVKKSAHNAALAVLNLDPGYLLEWDVSANSRGLTQIKTMPPKIASTYCVDVSELNDARVTAIATMGFLAQSLTIVRVHARNVGATYVNEDNLLDYVLYVYFGRLGQDVVRSVVDADGHVIQSGADPAANKYIRAVKDYIGQLEFYEAPSRVFVKRDANSACRAYGDR